MALTIKKGDMHLYYCFDVAYEIDLEKVQAALGDAVVASRIVCERVAPKYVQYSIPPLLIRLGRRLIKTPAGVLDADIKAKIYNFGVVTLIYNLAIKGPFAHLVELTHGLTDSEGAAATARQEVEDLVAKIASALTRPQQTLTYWEDYVVIKVQDFGRRIRGIDLLEKHKMEIARVLRCENERLSQYELDNAVKYPLSYYEDELVVVDWNCALVYDPRTSYDIQDTLEYALTEMLELRVYNHILDEALEHAYDDLQHPEGMRLVPYMKTVNELTRVKLDVTELLDHLTDSLKLIGDLYLAKVYKAAKHRFYLDDLKASLHEKIETIESMYTLLFERNNYRTLLILEWLIVGLFVLDLVLIFLVKG